MSSPLALPAPGAVAVGSLAQARKHKRQYDAVITLEDPGCRRSAQLRFYGQPHSPHLVLDFEDVDIDDGWIRVASEEQVATALAFAREHSPGSLLIHCYHGVGRSAVIALAVLADRLGPGCENEAMNRLLTIRPEATPNLVVVGHADAVLSRAGDLVGAVAAWEARTPEAVRLRKVRRAFVERNPDLYARRQPSGG